MPIARRRCCVCGRDVRCSLDKQWDVKRAWLHCGEPCTLRHQLYNLVAKQRTTLGNAAANEFAEAVTSEPEQKRPSGMSRQEAIQHAAAELLAVARAAAPAAIAERRKASKKAASNPTPFARKSGSGAAGSGASGSSRSSGKKRVRRTSHQMNEALEQEARHAQEFKAAHKKATPEQKALLLAELQK